VTQARAFSIRPLLKFVGNKLKALFNWTGVAFKSVQVLYRGVAVLSFLMNVALLVAVGLSLETGVGKLSPEMTKAMGDVLGKSNYAMTFLVITLLTFASTFAGRAQSALNVERTRHAAQHASEFFLMAAFDLFVSLGLIFTAQVITPESLKDAPGLFFELLHFMATQNKALGLSLGLLVVYDFACAVFYVWLSYFIPVAAGGDALLGISTDTKSNVSLPVVITIPKPTSIEGKKLENSAAPHTIKLQTKRPRKPKRH
jgi:hypothetical protein